MFYISESPERGIVWWETNRKTVARGCFTDNWAVEDCSEMGVHEPSDNKSRKKVCTESSECRLQIKDVRATHGLLWKNQKQYGLEAKTGLFFHVLSVSNLACFFSSVILQYFIICGVDGSVPLECRFCLESVCFVRGCWCLRMSYCVLRICSSVSWKIPSSNLSVSMDF